MYIDEAQDYFDESIQSLFNQARKYNIGLIIAHQNLDQFDQKLRATVLSSTSIKLVGGVSAKDAGVFAKEMNCEPEFLQNMRKGKGSTQFACFVRNHTRRIVRSVGCGSNAWAKPVAPMLLFAHDPPVSACIGS